MSLECFFAGLDPEGSIVTTFDGMSVGFEREAAANDNVTAFSQREIVHG